MNFWRRGVGLEYMLFIARSLELQALPYALNRPSRAAASFNSTLEMVRVLLSPATVRVNGPPACNGLSRTSQRPSFAVAVTVCCWNLTVTFSPSLAVPQTGTAMPRCSTAPSEKRLFGFTSARAAAGALAAKAAMAIARKSRFMSEKFIRIIELMESRRTEPAESLTRETSRKHEQTSTLTRQIPGKGGAQQGAIATQCAVVLRASMSIGPCLVHAESMLSPC